jgi:hypothetical protein
MGRGGNVVQKDKARRGRLARGRLVRWRKDHGVFTPSTCSLSSQDEKEGKKKKGAREGVCGPGKRSCWAWWVAPRKGGELRAGLGQKERKEEEGKRGGLRG